MKKLLLIILLLFSSFFYSCADKKEEVADNALQDTNKIKIGMSFDSFVIERWQRDRDVFVSTAKELGATVNVQNANGNVEEQISQIEYFISKKMDAIVIVSTDSIKLKDVVVKAKDAGIKIIAYDRLINHADVDLYISFDNVAVGRMMAEALIDYGFNHKKILMIGGPTTDHNVSMVETEFKEIMDKNGIEVIGRIHADGWKPELAGDYMNENDKLLDQVDAIMCGNDRLASQVVYALSERRLAGKIQVVGQDADLEACQRIVEGTQLMTVYKPVEKLAQTAAEYTIKLINGEKLEQIQTIDDGTYTVPYVALEVIAVDANNMEEVIIDSGFHLKEDVYLNEPDKMPK